VISKNSLKIPGTLLEWNGKIPEGTSINANQELLIDYGVVEKKAHLLGLT